MNQDYLCSPEGGVNQDCLWTDEWCMLLIIVNTIIIVYTILLCILLMIVDIVEANRILHWFSCR